MVNGSRESRTPRFEPEAVRSSVIAAISLLAFAGLVVGLVISSPNWPAVQKQFFSPKHFNASFWDVAGGFITNIEMFIISMLVIPVLALVVALMRSFRGPAFLPIRVISAAYVDFFRGVPLILLILMLGFGLPALDIPGLPRSAFFWGLTALSLSYSAYTAEIYRSGIDAVPESQRSSARALGLTQWQAFRYAILPQAIRNVVPALMNTVVSLQKDVALVSILGVREAVREAEIYAARSFNYTSYLVATLLFLLISIPLTRGVDWYVERDRRLRSQTMI